MSAQILTGQLGAKEVFISRNDKRITKTTSKINSFQLRESVWVQQNDKQITNTSILSC